MKNIVIGNCSRILTAFVFVAVLLSNAAGQTITAQTGNYEFINGNWFDGKRFKRQTLYAVNGFFVVKRPPKINEVVDLKNGFVVPPFADAHTHNFAGAFNLAPTIEKYLRDGVFYAKVQGASRRGALSIANSMNRPNSVEASYAHGMLTSSYGHGVEVYEGLAVLYKTGAETPEEVKKLRNSRTAENDAYYIIDTAQDLEQKWEKILAGKPDFLKIIIFNSEEYDERRNRADTIGDRGLDPKLVAPLVQKARAANLRVSAHVNTVNDYRVALAAGVDELAHLPGYYVGINDDPREVTLTREDARETARRKIWVVPAPIAYAGLEKAIRERSDAVLKHNLTLLKKARAPIAFGSDRFGSTPVDDALHIASLGVFTNLELLKIWSEDTPQTIFPNRRIGFLKDGYEASFLVLGGNPLENFGEIKNIRMRFKQGQPAAAGNPKTQTKL